MKKILISMLFIVIACGEAKEPSNELQEGSNFIPFEGTVFVSNNILNSSDNSSFTSLKKIPNEERTMFDRRINDDSKDYAQGSWINITPFLFTAFFSDGTEIEVQVNDEFENNTNAESVALSYLKVIGMLPKLF